MIGSEYRVHMPGQQHPHRRIGALDDMQVAAMHLRRDAPEGVDMIDGAGVDQRRYPAHWCHGCGQLLSHGVETGEVAAAAVDRRPGLDLRQHRCAGVG